MTTKELYTKGARIWISSPETVWEGAEVTEDFKSGVLVIRVDESGDFRTLVVKTDTDLPPLRNPSILIGENDLTSLSYLHEPAVLHNLKIRFCDLNAIYTYCGIVLVAINPYDDLPIYGEDTILAYRGQAMGDLDPHIFAVAEEAYTKLERERRDQSIIVSGESGAGKTVSAKYAMRYFATVGGSTTETQVEKKVLASSPIMEAIGNAKTTRNDNSSRFGKFIEIHFSKAFHIVGASMRTYLLEKSRVVFQAPGERNYHIFYQLCAVRDTMPELKLDHQDTFNFLNQGDNPIIDGVDDAKAFGETKQALTTLGFTNQEQSDMFKIWASILHLGNVNIGELQGEEVSGADEGEASFISPNDKHLAAFCSLVGAPVEATIHRLTHRRIVSRSETIESPLRWKQAHAARDALAKRLYAELFSWLVTGANRALRCTQPTVHFIGVLDIYGFETFETNSFEQFCINYANEKLQQQFNSHVFKLEQEEYLREEITWTMIHFSDNQPCIDLIEARLGVLDLLDEECRMPQGSDSSWAAKMHERCGGSAHFIKPRFEANAFAIRHFADEVMYQTSGFLEKNRDTVLEEQIELLKQFAASSLLRQLCGMQQQSTDTLGVPEPKPRVKISPAKPLTQSSTKQNRQSVGAQFRNSLTALMATLNATTPHYVRCIKPNDDKGAFVYDPARAVQQLRACGVLETIRISAAGFPSRWLYQDFFLRYRVLCNSKDINRNDSRATCLKIIEKCIKDEDKYRFGKAKLFFRAGQVAYLEKLRAERLRRCCIIMQSQLRAFVCRKKYLKIKIALAGLQRYGRGFLARRLAQELRRKRAAIILQKRIRGWLARLCFKRIKATALALQRYARGYLARKRFMQLKYNAAATTIQKHVRGWLARKRYAKMRYQVVICQSAIRRFLARRQYRKLRAEARSVEHVKQLNRGLENKIISLQQKLGDLQVDNKQIAHLVNEISDLKVKLEPLKGLEAELKELKLTLKDREAKIATLDQQLTQERDNSIELVEEKNKLNDEYSKQKEIWMYESSKMAQELMSLKETNIVSQKDSEKKMKEQYELEKRELLSELDLEKTAYQRLLTEQYQLQARLEEMQGRRSLRGHQRSLSNASTASQPENAAEEDIGYGSTRSTTSSSTIRAGLETIDWQKNGAPSDATEQSLPPTTDQSGDPGLIIRLQRRAKRAEEERARLARRVERLESARTLQPQAHSAEDQHRINDLEIECTRLTNDLNRLRTSVSRADGADVSSRELAEQFAAQQEELERRREECIQLRSVLANQKPWFQALKNVTVNLKSLATSNYGSDVDVINEDGELVQAFEAQKKITRQLEDELLSEKELFKETLADYKADIEKLREDNDKQQKLLTASLTSDPQTQMEQFIHYEVTRLTSENLNLQDKNDHLSVSVDKYKAQVALLMKKLKELGYQDFSQLSPKAENVKQDNQIVQKESSMLPVVRKRERDDYMGMFEYTSGTEPIILQRLVSELSPRTAVTLLPGLPAYVIFMCIRHTDHINDDEKVRGILTTFINSVKKVIKKKGDKVDTAVLWMANALRLLHCLKQYSGDTSYQFSNTAIQNEQCLRNFDLSEYRQLLSDVAVWIYQALIGIVERRIQGLIVPALLEYEEISGVSGGAPRGRAQSVAEGVPSTPAEIRSPANLCAEFIQIKKSLDYFGVDPDLAVQIFRQLYYYVCASCLNQLLLRKDLCHWLKGVQVRYNISYLETWFKENCANYNQEEVKGVQATLKPIIQAVCLLQARKSSADVQSTCDMCPDLTPMQICKILNLYTPTEDFEPKITVDFIRQIQACLQERNKDKPDGQPANLLMDTKYNFPVKFPFNPSAIRLEDIELPKALNLHDLLTKVFLGSCDSTEHILQMVISGRPE